MDNWHAQRLYGVIEDCLDRLHERPSVETEISPQDEFVQILDIIGHSHRKWLSDLWASRELNQEPILTERGEVVAEPLFWFNTAETTYACFGSELRQRVLQRLEDFGVRLLEAGQEIPARES